MPSSATPRVKRWFAKRPYYHLHFTPTGASWLNLVERFFAEITNKRIRRGVFRSGKEQVAAAGCVMYIYVLEGINNSAQHPAESSGR